MYYVYQLIDPRNNKPFYIGKGSGNRAYQHLKFKDGNINPYKDRKIKRIIQAGLEPIVEFLYQDIVDESHAYDLEEAVIKKIGIQNLTNMAEDRRPPSRKGWVPTQETLAKRSAKLKGIPRTKEWRTNLSNSKQGDKNGMFGVKLPCSNDRRLAVIRGKNIKNYELYKHAIHLMNTGVSANNTAISLNIGRGVCFRLKNRTHMIFEVFPELI